MYNFNSVTTDMLRDKNTCLSVDAKVKELLKLPNICQRLS